MPDEQSQLRLDNSGQTAVADSRTPREEKIKAREHLLAFCTTFDELFLLTGPADTGKTALVSDVLAHLDPDMPAAMLDGADLEESSLFKSVCRAFGVANWSGDWEMTLNSLAARFRPHNHAFLVVDNAHALTAPALDDIRLLSYLRGGKGPLLQTILVGRDELLPKIDACDMARLRIWRIQREELIFPGESNLYAVGDDSLETAAGHGEVESAAQVSAVDRQAGGEGESNIPAGEQDTDATLDISPGPDSPAVEGSTVSSRADLDSDETARVTPASVIGLRTAAEQGASWIRTVTGKAALALVAIVLVGVVVFFPESDTTVGVEIEPAAVRSPIDEDPERRLPEDEQSSARQAETLEMSQTAVEALPTPATEVAVEAEIVASVTVESAATLPAPDSPSLPAGENPVAESAEAVKGEPVADAAESPGLAAEATPVDATEARKGEAVAGLLAAADAALKKDFLSTPYDKSAWSYYSQVLVMDKGNTAAQQGMQDITDRYAVLIRAAIKEQRYADAQTLIDRGLGIAADHRALFALEDELARAIARREAEALAQQQRSIEAGAETEAEPEAEVRELGTGQKGLFDFLRDVFTPADQTDVGEEP